MVCFLLVEVHPARDEPRRHGSIVHFPARAGAQWRTWEVEVNAEARILKLRMRQFMTQMSVSRLSNCDKMAWQAARERGAGACPGEVDAGSPTRTCANSSEKR